MKKSLLILTAAMFNIGLAPVFAQMGQMPHGPQLDGAMAKLFGDNSAFTASLEYQVKQKSGDGITLPGKISFDSGNSRFEMNMSEAKGMKLPPNAMAQMKSMGLDQMATLTKPKDQFICIVYPGLQSYVQMPLPEKNGVTNETFKVTTTELGKEMVDGHPCVKNKTVVTNGEGDQREYTVWNATDLKNFPVKIVHDESDSEITMLFTDISLTKPATSVFEVSAGYTRYDNLQTMMQTEMMKKMGGGMGMPVH